MSEALDGGLEQSAPRRRGPALVLGLAAFLTQFDVTAVATALPGIGAELGLGMAEMARVMDAYSLAFTAALLAAGALADRHGRRRAMLVGNGVFLLASIACGLAPDGPTLCIARAAQGLGAAFATTGAIALIAGAYPGREQRAGAFALVGIVSGVAMALGPTLGGLVAGLLGWRWIFLANIPLCVCIAWAVPRLVPEARGDEARPLDWPGLILLTLALGAAVEALLNGRNSLPLLASGMVLSLALLAVFLRRQRRMPRPMLDAAIFAQRALAGVAAILVAVSVGYWALLVYLPLFLHASFGWQGEAAGAALLAATAPMLLLPAYGVVLANSLGWRKLFALSLAIICAGASCLALGALGGADGPLHLGMILGGMLLIGAGAALSHPQLSGAVLALAPAGQAGMASAVTVVMRQGGFALGIAALGALLPSGASSEDYGGAFLLAALASAAGAAAAWTLLPAATELLRQGARPG